MALESLTLIVLPVKLKAELLVVVFNLTVPAFNILALIIAIVPLVAFTPAVFPFKVIAKLAFPLLIFPFSPSGVRTVFPLKTLPLVILCTCNKVGS